MNDTVKYSTKLRFYQDLTEIVPDFKAPALNAYTDKVLLPPSVLSDLISQQSASGYSLPSPLVFKISVRNKGSCFVGVREFSAPEQCIILPRVIREKLGISQVNEETEVALELSSEILKGTSLVLKPLDPDYNITDWKFFLEAKLNSEYTTLTQGEILNIKDKNQVYKLLIDAVEPAPTVSIVDTDIDLSIEPLNDEHARAMQENNSRRHEIIELTDLITVQSLSVDSEDYKFKVPLTSNQILLQLVIRDQEFDNTFLDILVSEDQFINKESFLWSTLDPTILTRKDNVIQLKIRLDDTYRLKNEYIYVMPYLWNSRTIFDLKIASSLEDISLSDATEPEVRAVGENEAICENCGAVVPQSSLFLHQNFCLRNNKLCPKGCGKVFHKAIPAEHWHCELCDNVVFGDSKLTLDHHNAIFHQSYTCECEKGFPNFLQLARHKATDCEFRLHECRYCHLVVPREESTTIDIFKEVSHHENSCGSKTIDCSKCGKPVMLSNYESHMKLHDLDRQSQLEPQKCCNVNCVKTTNLNEFGLCDVCFGPSFSTVHDPTNAKLQARLERRYVIQLTKGCGSTWCKNAECKSSGLSKSRSMGEIVKHVKEDLLTHVPTLPLNKGLDVGTPAYSFCVDGSMTKKKLLLDWLSEEGVYSYNWCCDAVNHESDEQTARRWLQENAISLNE